MRWTAVLTAVWQCPRPFALWRRILHQTRRPGAAAMRARTYLGLGLLSDLGSPPIPPGRSPGRSVGPPWGVSHREQDALARSGHVAGRRRGGRWRSSRRRPPSCPQPDSPEWPPCAGQMRPGPRRLPARGATRPSHLPHSAMSLRNAAVWWQVVSMAISGLGVTGRSLLRFPSAGGYHRAGPGWSKFGRCSRG